MKEEQLYYMAIDRNIASADRICRNATRERARRRAFPRACRIVAASLLVLVGCIACIPSARAAVLRWLNPAVDPNSYLRTPAEQRESVPAIEQAIEPAAKKPITVSVTGAVSDEWKTWAERLSVSFDEILYDGETIYVTGNLMGNTTDFVKDEDEYIQEEDAQGTMYSPPDNMVACYAQYVVNGGEKQNTHMSAFANPFFGEDVAALIAGGSLPIALRLPTETGLTGEQQLTVELGFIDFQTVRSLGEYADFSEYPQVLLRIEGLTFDATAGTSGNSALPGTASAALSGDARVFMIEERSKEGKAEVGNDVLSLAGGTFWMLGMQQKLGGTAMTFAVTLPESWTKAQCESFSDRINVVFVIDSEEQGGFGRAYMSLTYHDTAANLAARGASGVDVGTAPAPEDFRNVLFTLETGLLPEDWARIRSLEVLLEAEEITTYNGVAAPDNARAEAPWNADGWSQDSEMHRFFDCPLVIR